MVASPSAWEHPGPGAAARVEIPGRLMVCDGVVLPTVAFPVRLRPEIEFWLCGQGCAGWVAGSTRVPVDRPTRSYIVYEWRHWVDFTNANDAFWFTMKWT